MFSKSISNNLLLLLLLSYHLRDAEAFQPISSNKISKSAKEGADRSCEALELDSSSTKQFLSSISTFAANEASSKYNNVFPDDWEDVASRAFESDKRPIILFDGICNLCNESVNFALDHDPNGTFRFASLQSRTGKSLLMQAGRHPEDLSTIIVVRSDGSHYDKSDAILYISQGLEGLGFKVLANTGSLVPKVIRDLCYKVISKNRFRFGSGDQCRIDFDGEFDGRFVEDPPSLSLCTSSD